MNGPLDQSLWEAARLPEGFTAADGIMLMAIESGWSPQSWQFDYIARLHEAHLSS